MSLQPTNPATLASRVPSKRTYTTQEGAVKAWNKATGDRYRGRSGGWIYDHSVVGQPRRMGQGWCTLIHRAGVVWDAEAEGYRYQVRPA